MYETLHLVNSETVSVERILSPDPLNFTIFITIGKLSSYVILGTTWVVVALVRCTPNFENGTRENGMKM